ncbi:MAG: flagellin N-terminal helical domain-containing protein [Pseudooceanicola sp.]
MARGRAKGPDPALVRTTFHPFRQGRDHQRAQSVLRPKEPGMSSILTNNSAMVALQTLKSVNMSMSETQSQISTGKRVASAKDNSTVWNTFALVE